MTLAIRLTCRRWGAYCLGDVHLRAHDRSGCSAGSATWTATPPQGVPRPRRCALVRPSETLVSTGSHAGLQRGDGIEFADLRPPGRPALLGQLAGHRPPRRADGQPAPPRTGHRVVLFLDSLLDVRGPTGSTLDQAVARPLRRPRPTCASGTKGLVSFGGFVQRASARQRPGWSACVDTLMETQVFATAAWKGIRHLPPRTLLAKALIVALTPLVDERGVAALFDLLARGYDLAVVDISPLTHAVARAGEWGGLAWRLWALERETLRHRYQRLGAAVVEWPDAMHPAGAPGGGGMPAPRRARTRLACGLAAAAVAAVLAVAPLAAAGALRDARPGWPGSAWSWPPWPPCACPRCSAPALVVLSPSTRSSWSAGRPRRRRRPGRRRPVPVRRAGQLGRRGPPRVRDERPVLTTRAIVVAASTLAALAPGVRRLPPPPLPAGDGLTRLAVGVLATTAILALVVMVAHPTSTRRACG